jgi:hypothetical protein
MAANPVRQEDEEEIEVDEAPWHVIPTQTPPETPHQDDGDEEDENLGGREGLYRSSLSLSGFQGVYPHGGGMWRVEYGRENYGVYHTPEEAAQVYKEQKEAPEGRPPALNAELPKAEAASVEARRKQDAARAERDAARAEKRANAMANAALLEDERLEKRRKQDAARAERKVKAALLEDEEMGDSLKQCRNCKSSKVEAKICRLKRKHKGKNFDGTEFTPPDYEAYSAYSAEAEEAEEAEEKGDIPCGNFCCGRVFPTEAARHGHRRYCKSMSTSSTKDAPPAPGEAANQAASQQQDGVADDAMRSKRPSEEVLEQSSPPRLDSIREPCLCSSLFVPVCGRCQSRHSPPGRRQEHSVTRPKWLPK